MGVLPDVSSTDASLVGRSPGGCARKILSAGQERGQNGSDDRIACPAVLPGCISEQPGKGDSRPVVEIFFQCSCVVQLLLS